jgi:hypothetical protein
MSALHHVPQPLELEMDLASLASQAAIELDDLFLGRRKDLTAVGVLVDKIAAGLPEGKPLDATTVVAVQRALIDTPGSKQTTTVSELQSSAAEMTARLSGLINGGDVKPPAPDVLEQLRSFCVALSKHSTALQRSPYDRREHPFQR